MEIDAWAIEEGLIYLGTVPLDPGHDFDRYAQWLNDKKHAGMTYLAQNVGVRKNPEKLLPGAKSAIVLALPYDLGDEWPRKESTPRIAQYARIDDYHRVFRKRAGNLAQKLSGVTRVVVDTAPLLERALAAKTRAGFVGKNTCYIHPEHGSLLLLGEILSTEPLPFDVKLDAGGCGTCTQCQKHCPTGALNEDYSIDARRCLAFWTIEHRGPIPEEFWPWMGEYYFGCDICQLVCPYNKISTTKAKLPERKFPPLFEVATMDQSAYERYFGGTAMTRAKRNGLRRNALIAMAVTRDPQLSEALSLAGKDNESPIQETLQQIDQYLSRNSQPV